MVKNSIREYLEEEIGRSVNPYDSDVPLSSEEAKDEYQFWMEGAGFEEVDKLIYHPSPSAEEDDERFGLLEKVALDHYSRGNNPEIYVSERDRERVEQSEVLHSGPVNYIDPEVTEDDIAQAFETSSAGRSIHVTSDYHAEGVYSLRETFDDSDFIVLSADTTDLDPDPENYSEILGPLGPVASRTVDWDTLAEGKEVGRKLLDSIRDPRF